MVEVGFHETSSGGKSPEENQTRTRIINREIKNEEF